VLDGVANDDGREGQKSGASASAEQLSASSMRRPAVLILPASCLSEAEAETSEWCMGLGGGRLDKVAMNGHAALAAEGSLSRTLLRQVDDMADLILVVVEHPHRQLRAQRRS
jgi:hypothetical protein